MQSEKFILSRLIEHNTSKKDKENKDIVIFPNTNQKGKNLIYA